MINIGWKVVTEDLRSSFMQRSGVQYAINEETKPINGLGPLTVFTSLEKANAYLSSCNEKLIIFRDYKFEKFRIFRCNYQQSKHELVWIDTSKKIDKDYLVRMINNRNSKFSSEDIALADSVKLLEEITK